MLAGAMTGRWMTGIWASHEPTFSCQQYFCHESLAESNRWMRGGKAGTLMVRKWDYLSSNCWSKKHFPPRFAFDLTMPQPTTIHSPTANDETSSQQGQPPQCHRTDHLANCFLAGQSRRNAKLNCHTSRRQQHQRRVFQCHRGTGHDDSSGR